MQKQVQQSPAVTPQLYYFRSYAILNWVQNNLSQAIFLFFPLSYTILSSQLHYFPLLSPQLHYLFPLVELFFLFSPQLSYLPPISNSVAAKIAQDIYYRKTTPELSYFHNYNTLKQARMFTTKKQPPSYAISTYARFFQDTMIAQVEELLYLGGTVVYDQMFGPAELWNLPIGRKIVCHFSQVTKFLDFIHAHLIQKIVKLFFLLS